MKGHASCSAVSGVAPPSRGTSLNARAPFASPPPARRGRRASFIATTWRIVRTTVVEIQADQCPLLAAALAYQVLFALIPVVALLVAMLGFVLRMPEVRQAVVDRVLA